MPDPSVSHTIYTDAVLRINYECGIIKAELDVELFE